MRTVIRLTVLLVGIVWCAAATDWPSADVSTSRPSTVLGWRRGKDGWERAGDWTSEATEPKASAGIALPHPVLIADVELLLAVGSLVFLSPRKGHKSAVA